MSWVAEFIRSFSVPKQVCRYPLPEGEEADSAEPAYTPPTGYGLTFRGLKVFGSPLETADMCARYNFSFVKLWLESDSPQIGTHYPKDLGEYVRAFRDHHIRVIGMGWPMAGKARKYRDQMLREAAKHNITDICTNGEKQWWPARKGRGIGTTSEIMREVDITLGGFKERGIDNLFSSYGRMDKSFSSMPLEHISQYCEVGQPQTYTTAPGLIAQRLDSWRAHGFLRLLPVLGSVRKPHNDPPVWLARAKQVHQDSGLGINIWDAFMFGHRTRLWKEHVTSLALEREWNVHSYIS